MRSAAPIRVPKALRGPMRAAGRQGRRSPVASRPLMAACTELRFIRGST